MAGYTKNYNFKKPEKTDYFNINDQNENWNHLDEVLPVKAEIKIGKKGAEIPNGTLLLIPEEEGG